MYVFTLSYFNCKRVANVKFTNENFSNIIVISGNLIGSVFADYLPIYRDLHTLPLIEFIHSVFGFGPHYTTPGCFLPRVESPPRGVTLLQSNVYKLH